MAFQERRSSSVMGQLSSLIATAIVVIALTLSSAVSAQSLNLAPDWTRDTRVHPRFNLAWGLFRCFTVDEAEPDCAALRDDPATLAVIAEVVSHDCIESAVFRLCTAWMPLIGGGHLREEFWRKHGRLVEVVYARFKRLCEDRPAPPGCRWFYG